MNLDILKLHHAYDKHRPVFIGRLDAVDYDVAYCSCGVFYCAQAGDVGYPRYVAGLADGQAAGWAIILAAHPQLKDAWAYWHDLCATAGYDYGSLAWAVNDLAGKRNP